MKLRTLCAAAVVAVIGASVVAPAGASAQTTQEGTGKVEVKAGLIDPEEPNIVDPEEPGEIIDPEDPGVIVNPDIKDKGIISVPALDFGEISIGTVNVSAKPLANNGETRGNIVSFGDVTGVYTGYTISGNLTSQFATTGSEKLDGATITFTNPIVETDGVGTIGVPVGTVKLTEDGGAEEFIRAAAGQGQGKWSLEFGQSDTYTGTAGTAGTADKAVQLDIPTSVANSMVNKEYNAVITWTMGALA